MRFEFLCAGAALLAIFPNSAHAAPPASCIKKFLGSWTWSASTGVAVTLTFKPDGTAACTSNPFCAGGDTWTCNGNQLSLKSALSGATMTLSADGRRMTGAGGIPPNPQVAVRIGGAPTSLVASAPLAEQGLISGLRFPLSAPVRGLEQELAQILLQINIAEIENWKRENADDARKKALAQRVLDTQATLRQAAKEGRWNIVQRTLPAYKRMYAEYQAYKAKEH